MPCATSAAKATARAAAPGGRWRRRAARARRTADHRQHADEAEFLGDHREQEVGVRLRQVEELLDAAAQADAEPFAAAEGDQRMRELVALAEGIRQGSMKPKMRSRRYGEVRPG
jgi:hypothetical protein